jgi:transcriptional regulatory protein AMDR
LLLQSILLAGAHVSQHPKVVGSRSLVKMTLFRRAKALFDMHFENDRMHLVQSALLFTWHFEVRGITQRSFHPSVNFDLGMLTNFLGP